MRDNRPIGIFDSGVGGLSILREVKKHLPNESFVYLADQANNPYGGRSEKEIQKLSSNVITFLLARNVKLIIIACNTATVSSISYLREKFDIPLIGVVPVIKTIAQSTKSGKVAVFSTPATAKSKYLADLIEKFGGSAKVYKVGSSGLEHLIEEGIVDGPKIDEALKSALKSINTEGIDCIALGCTHYPFVVKEIIKVVGPRIKIFDSGDAIGRRTREVLDNEHLQADGQGEDFYYTTGDPKRFKMVAEKLLGVKLKNIDQAKL
jgi:glutamate racemase